MLSWVKKKKKLLVQQCYFINAWHVKEHRGYTTLHVVDRRGTGLQNAVNKTWLTAIIWCPRSRWLIHSPLATTWHACFKIYIMGWGLFFCVMWQLVFNSLHGNGQNKPRACLLQGRCTTSSGPLKLVHLCGGNIGRPRCCFFHFFIHFKTEWCWFDKSFFKMLQCIALAKERTWKWQYFSSTCF